MATKQLTPRQKEIKALMDQGKTPTEVAKKLKISDNGVYQQLRRMRAAGHSVGGKTATAKSTSARKPAASKAKSSGSKRTTSGRSSARKSTPARPRATTPPIPSQPKLVAMTPLDSIKARREQIDAELTETRENLDAATRAHEEAVKAHEDATSKYAAELSQLTAAEAALKGEAPKPKSNGSA